MVVSIILQNICSSNCIPVHYLLSASQVWAILLVISPSSLPVVQVTDSKGQPVLCQVNPVLYGESPASDRFLVVFEATLPPLGVAHYKVTGTSQSSKHTVRASIQYINSRPPADRGK